MSSTLNQIDNTTFTISTPEIETTAMEEFVKQIKQRIFMKKLNGFKLVDYTNEPPALPIFKPTLNSNEIKLILSEIKPGELKFGKSTQFSKVMIYMDDNGVAWEVAAHSNNIIIDIEMCRSPCTTKLTDTNKISSYIEDIISSINMNCNYTYPNVYNKVESHEYKMILTAILKGVCSEPSLKLEPELVSQTINQVTFLDSWKVLIVKSVDNQAHVFASKDSNGNIWVVETDWEMNQVITTYQLETSK